jgi:hypothetical protein
MNALVLVVYKTHIKRQAEDISVASIEKSIIINRYS